MIKIKRSLPQITKNLLRHMRGAYYGINRVTIYISNNNDHKILLNGCYDILYTDINYCILTDCICALNETLISIEYKESNSFENREYKKKINVYKEFIE